MQSVASLPPCRAATYENVGAPQASNACRQVPRRLEITRVAEHEDSFTALGLDHPVQPVVLDQARDGGEIGAAVAGRRRAVEIISRGMIHEGEAIDAVLVDRKVA